MTRTLAMFTDTSLCIGCRACQVACKQWNELGLETPEWTGTYQNHAHFTEKTFRLVRFIETRYAEAETERLVAAAFPGAAIESHPMTLREIFVAVARQQREARR